MATQYKNDQNHPLAVVAGHYKKRKNKRNGKFRLKKKKKIKLKIERVNKRADIDRRIRICVINCVGWVCRCLVAKIKKITI